MGRGLSDLQKWMLRRALDNREREGGHDEAWFPDLVFAEVKEGFYHLQRRPVYVWPGKPEYEAATPERRLHKLKLGRLEDYTRQRIFEKPRPLLNRIIPRAVTRLEQRGYARRVTWGLQLTDAGIVLARSLTAGG